MLFDEFLTHHEHAAAAAAGVEHPALVWFYHFHQQLYNRARGVELAAFFAFGEGELAEKIFIHFAEQVSRFRGFIAEGDVADQVDQLAQRCGCDIRPGEYFRQNAFQGVVLSFYGLHGFV